jgi:hypothetical protein
MLRYAVTAVLSGENTAMLIYAKDQNIFNKSGSLGEKQ